MNNITTPIESLSKLAIMLGGGSAAQLYKVIDFITAQSSDVKSAFVAGFHAGWDCGVVDELPTDDETIEEQWQEFVSPGTSPND